MATRTTTKTAPKTGCDVTSALEYLTRTLKAPTLREFLHALLLRHPPARRRVAHDSCREAPRDDGGAGRAQRDPLPRDAAVQDR